jgi:hypothetical protein
MNNVISHVANVAMAAQPKVCGDNINHASA